MAFEHYERVVGNLIQAAENAQQCFVTRRSRIEGPPRKLGRPLGTDDNSPFRLFTAWLITIVEHIAGGRLTLSEHNGTGSLPQALRLLAPCLPPSVIPRRLPPLVLRRLLKERGRERRPGRLSKFHH